MAVSKKCDGLDLQQFTVKTLLRTCYFGDWSCEHEQLAKFVPHAIKTILIGIRVIAKYTRPENPDFISREAILCGPDALKWSIFKQKKGLRTLV
jgi:hypothetical protein